MCSIIVLVCTFDIDEQTHYDQPPNFLREEKINSSERDSKNIPYHDLFSSFRSRRCLCFGTRKRNPIWCNQLQLLLPPPFPTQQKNAVTKTLEAVCIRFKVVVLITKLWLGIMFSMMVLGDGDWFHRHRLRLFAMRGSLRAVVSAQLVQQNHRCCCWQEVCPSRQWPSRWLRPLREC